MLKKDAVSAAGSVRALASLLGISTQAVHMWGDEVPPLRAYQIATLLPEVNDVKDEKDDA